MAKEILLIEIKENGARVVRRNIDDIGGSAERTGTAIAKLGTLLAGLVSVKVIKDTVMLADAYANLLNRIRVVTGSNLELKIAMDGVAKISRETRTSLEANVDMYARIALNTKKMGFEYKDVLRFQTQLNHAIILSGVTAREAQWGMVQFSQGLAAGALRGDELRSVMEQLPVVTDVITDHLKITRGELRKWAFEGRVTTRVIIDAFNEADKNLAERFAKRLPTIDQGLTDLRSSFIRFIGEQDQAWQSTSSFASTLMWASKNMEVLGRVAQVAATVIGGILLANMLKMAAGWQLFNFSVIKTHAALVLFVAAAATIAVFADKIQIATGEAATLSDVIRGMGPEFKVVGEAAKYMWNSMADTTGLSKIKIATDTSVTDILMGMAKIADNFAGVFQGVYKVISNMFDNIGTLIKTLVTSIGLFFKAVGNKIASQMSQISIVVRSVAKSVAEALKGNVELAKMYAGIATSAAATELPSVADYYATELAKLDPKQFELSGKTSGEAFMEGFRGAGTSTQDMMKRSIGRGKDIADKRVSGKLAKGSDEGALTPQQSELLKKITGDTTKYIGEMADLKMLFDTNRISVNEYNRALVDMRQSSLETATDVGAGFQRGFMQVGLEITNFADTAEKTITNAFKGMEDALVSFVTTGKVDFKGLVDSILADLTRLVARQMISQALGAAMGAMGGGGGMLASLFAGASTAGGGGGTPLPSGTAPRANGGHVSAGGAYMVGERGPEPFFPTRSGNIMSNENMKSAAAPAPAAVQPITLINIWSTDDIGDYMSSPDGERIIINKSPGGQKQS